jgi:hypothetical protein
MNRRQIALLGAGWFDIEAGALDAGSQQCSLPPEAAGRWIAFDSNFGGDNRDIYLVRADGSVLGRLTTDPSAEKEPAFD